uniref:Uncharacterized protein n=1 Tax=Setaria italica TaxID=4555 RepID=K3YXC1_SETIT
MSRLAFGLATCSSVRFSLPSRGQPPMAAVVEPRPGAAAVVERCMLQLDLLSSQADRHAWCALVSCKATGKGRPTE